MEKLLLIERIEKNLSAAVLRLHPRFGKVSRMIPVFPAADRTADTEKKYVPG